MTQIHICQAAWSLLKVWTLRSNVVELRLDKLGGAGNCLSWSLYLEDLNGARLGG